MVKGFNIYELTDSYKGIIFDLDGTLVNLNVDWQKLKEELTKCVKEKTGCNVEFSPLDKVLWNVKHLYGEELFYDLLKIIEFYENQYTYTTTNNQLVSFIDNNVEKKLALYTMNTQNTAISFCEKTLKKGTNSFSVMVTKNTCLLPKPSEQDILMIIHQWCLDKKDILYIGDSQNDLESGKMAGINTFIIGTSKNGRS